MPTIIDKFEKSVTAYGRRVALAYIQGDKYHHIDYNTLNNHRLQIANWWSKLGFIQGQKVSVMLPNSPEWIIVDLVSVTLGLTMVPLHTTYNHVQLNRVIEHAQVDYLIVNQEYFDEHKEPFLKYPFKKIIIVGLSDDDSVAHWPVLKYKKDIPQIKTKVLESDLHTIIYTSGTTGDPKGVMLSHQNLVSDVESAKRNIDIKEADKFFSFLPLSHAFERAAGYYSAIFSGASIYFAQNSKTIIEDIKKAKPTILTSVPRIFEKVYDKIFDKIGSGKAWKKKMFYHSLKLSRLSKSGKLSFLEKIQLNLLDKIVLDKIRNTLGGHLRMAVSGGASLNPTIAKFFENIGLPIIEGYGLTETSPIVAVNKLDNYKFGTVGSILDCNKVKIADNKEIIISGDNIMMGYYDNPKATEESIKDGWFYTGDLGFIDEDNFLTIIGRAKDIIVLSTGKNIFPEPIENALNESRYINQSFVYGDNNKNLSVLIVPDLEELAIWCRKNEADFSFPDVLKDNKILGLYEQKIVQKLKDFTGVEKVKNFILTDKEFNQENGLLTPTLKLRRKMIKDMYNL
ncbi:long-chain fatty acid--CoA ligase [bacterium]|jgi:long-chain acyl-CoA synthetase|nr:long-chain fatty acid--CoA ligase [bacterium]